jgi:hypothetical protein
MKTRYIVHLVASERRELVGAMRERADTHTQACRLAAEAVKAGFAPVIERQDNHKRGKQSLVSDFGARRTNETEARRTRKHRAEVLQYWYSSCLGAASMVEECLS